MASTRYLTSNLTIINNKPEFDKDSNRVTATPPPTETKIEKKVDGADYKKLDTADQVFNHTVDVTVPKKTQLLSMCDTSCLELQFDGEATATLDGTPAQTTLSKMTLLAK